MLPLSPLRLALAAAALASLAPLAGAAPYTVLPNTRCHNHEQAYQGLASLDACWAQCSTPLVSFCPSSASDCPEPGGCWCYPAGQLPNCDSDANWLSAFAPSPEPPPSAYDYSAPGAFADHLCDLAFADAAGARFEFDLRPVAGVVVNGSGFALAPCGVTAFACAMLPVPQPLGAAVQLSAGGGASCFYGLTAGPPLTTLRDAANAATGGLVTTYASAWTQTSNGPSCGDWDPARGREEGRTLILQHACDPAAAPGAVALLGVTEAPACTYSALISSAAACGARVAEAAASKATAKFASPASAAGGVRIEAAAASRSAASAPVANPPGPALPPWAPGAGPMSPYLCTPILADAAGRRWRYSLQQLFRAGADYTVATPVGDFALNVCGWTRTTCTPAYAVRANFGALVVAWAGGAPPPSGTQCRWANGTSAPSCSAPCRTLAEGAPVFSLANASDGAAGGLVMALQGELASADEPAPAPQCGDDENGDPLFPSVRVAIACDASVPTLAVDGVKSVVGAGAACSFLVAARASAACGVAA